MASELARAVGRYGFVWLVLLGLGCTGCFSGVVFTHVVVPLDANFDRTLVQTGSARDDTKRFQYRVRVEWGDQAVGEIAQRNGIETVHYADLETLSVLGVWSQRWVRIYGE
jgi:hypothetical protein